jgi:hypothetical protein
MKEIHESCSAYCKKVNPRVVVKVFVFLGYNGFAKKRRDFI